LILLKLFQYYNFSELIFEEARINILVQIIRKSENKSILLLGTLAMRKFSQKLWDYRMAYEDPPDQKVYHAIFGLSYVFLKEDDEKVLINTAWALYYLLHKMPQSEFFFFNSKSIDKLLILLKFTSIFIFILYPFFRSQNKRLLLPCIEILKKTPKKIVDVKFREPEFFNKWVNLLSHPHSKIRKLGCRVISKIIQVEQEENELSSFVLKNPIFLEKLTFLMHSDSNEVNFSF